MCHGHIYDHRTPSPDMEELQGPLPHQNPYGAEAAAPARTLGDIETCHDHTLHSRICCANVEDPETRTYCPASRGLEPTTMPNSALRESNLAQGSAGIHNYSTISICSDEPGPSTCQEQTIHDAQGVGLHEPVLDESAERENPRWTVFYFRLTFLTTFSKILILILVGLEVLYHVSQQNQGLLTASEGMHYAWTYGPTFCESEYTSLRNLRHFSDTAHSSHHGRGTLGSVGAMYQADNAVVHYEPHGDGFQA